MLTWAATNAQNNFQVLILGVYIPIYLPVATPCKCCVYRVMFAARL